MNRRCEAYISCCKGGKKNSGCGQTAGTLPANPQVQTAVFEPEIFLNPPPQQIHFGDDVTQLFLFLHVQTGEQQHVYGKIVGISTIAAIVTASVALLLMNFSKSGKTVDESRACILHLAIM